MNPVSHYAIKSHGVWLRRGKLNFAYFSSYVKTSPIGIPPKRHERARSVSRFYITRIFIVRVGSGSILGLLHPS